MKMLKQNKTANATIVMRKIGILSLSFTILSLVGCSPSKSENDAQRISDSIRVADSIKAAEKKSEEDKIAKAIADSVDKAKAEEEAHEKALTACYTKKLYSEEDGYWLFELKNGKLKLTQYCENSPWGGSGTFDDYTGRGVISGSSCPGPETYTIERVGRKYIFRHRGKDRYLDFTLRE